MGNIVVLTGAGISAESGLGTFRDKGGLWNKFNPTELANPRTFARDPGRVHEFYNMRRANCVDPCPENALSRVRNPDSNLVREPVSKPVKEEEGAQAREGLDEGFFGSLLSALGFDPDGPLPGWWQGWPPREHVRRWQTDLGLTATEIIETAEASRQEHPEPPDGPKALDRVMQRAAQRKADDASRKRRKQKAVTAHETRPITDLPIFYAEMVNSDRYVPVSAISNSMRDVMLARGLVTAERLRERGIR